jgi:hypothetical protein
MLEARKAPMPATDSRLTPDEIARVGVEILQRDVLPVSGPSDKDKFVAIDICTRDFEVDADDFAAVTKLRKKQPSAQIWLGRIGQPAAYRMRRQQ